MPWREKSTRPPPARRVQRDLLGQRTVAALATALPQTHPRHRPALVYALQACAPQHGSLLAVSLDDDPDPVVHVALALTLRAAVGTAALRVLKRLTTDEDAYVRDAAQGVLDARR